MLGGFGTHVFGSVDFILEPIVKGGEVALLGDVSSHGGTLITNNQDGTLKVSGITVCLDDCLHSCPHIGHGITSVTAVTVKTYHNNKLIITKGARAECGATILPSDRNVYVE